MKGFYARKNYYIIQCLLVLLIIVLGWIVGDYSGISLSDMLLFGSALLIVITGVVFGLLPGLGVSLVVMFLFGTSLIWAAFFSSASLPSEGAIVLWMVVLLVAPIITGLLHKWVMTLSAEHKEMSDKFEQFVTIDETTGFDNKRRFFFELEEEFNRSQRVQAPFSLLLIQIKYYDKFCSLYGQKEADHLMQTLSGILWNHTRRTDRKFRLEEDTFAIILTNTSETNVDIVIEKIEHLCKNHELINKRKKVTLTFSFDISSYNESLSDYMELVQNANHELEQYIQ